MKGKVALKHQWLSIILVFILSNYVGLSCPLFTINLLPNEDTSVYNKNTTLRSFLVYYSSTQQFNKVSTVVYPIVPFTCTLTRDARVT